MGRGKVNMTQLTRVTVLNRSTPSLLTAVSDLDIVQTASGEQVLMATSRSGGAISVYSLNNNGAANLIDSQSLTTDTETLEILSLNGNDYVVALGPQSSTTRLYSVNAAGEITGGALTISAAVGASTSVADVQIGGTTYLYCAEFDASSPLDVLRLGNGTSLTSLPNSGMPSGVSEVLQASAGSGQYLLTVTNQGAQISSYAVQSDGRLMARDVSGAGTGLGIAEISALAEVTLDGQTYIIAAGRGSSSLSILHLAGNGTLTPVDHIIDTLHTRFQNVTALDTATIGDRVFVVAGGADDGVSLFELLPGGRLMHHSTLWDQTNMTLSDVSSLAMTAVNGSLQIFVGSGTETGVTQLEAEIGSTGTTQVGSSGNNTLTGSSAGEVLFGGAGNDWLSGWAGNDILMDGAGQDTLIGGNGQDVFVMDADGDYDEIRSFDPSQDRIDLSNWPMLRDISQLGFSQTGNGARITYRDETLRIFSADGQPLTLQDIIRPDLISVDRHLTNDPSLTQIDFLGGLSSDLLIANDLNNRIVGDMGKDVLIGNGGNDVLIGDYVDNSFDDVAGQVVRLYLATLARMPGLAGHSGWTEQIISGLTLQEAAAGFVNSNEFQSRYGSTTNEGFVTLLYQNVLGRDPDAAGLANWVNQLNAGTSREAVVLGFSESNEFETNTAGESLSFSRAAYQASWSDDVYRTYQATLDRAPDSAGFEYWTSNLANGATMLDAISGFVNSAEFQGRYGSTTNEGFVTLLYQNVLGRDPDAAGLANWAAQLSSGALTRAEVVRGFVQSGEFIEDSADALESWMRGQGGDRLEGGGGTNTLFGGIGADTFAFDQTDGGTQIIVDMEAWDTVELQNSTFGSINGVLNALTQSGSDVILNDGTTTIRFADITLAQFDNDMFVFA